MPAPVPKPTCRAAACRHFIKNHPRQAYRPPWVSHYHHGSAVHLIKAQALHIITAQALHIITALPCISSRRKPCISSRLRRVYTPTLVKTSRFCRFAPRKSKICLAGAIGACLACVNTDSLTLDYHQPHRGCIPSARRAVCILPLTTPPSPC